MQQFFLPLHEMTRQEKISAMELLWYDLSQTPESYDSPMWHGEELIRREAEGHSFIDWEKVKQDIPNNL